MTKGSSQEERREARSRSKFCSIIDTGYLVDVGMAGKGKVDDDLDSFSSVFPDLPTVNAYLIFVKWRKSKSCKQQKHFQEKKDTVCLDGTLYSQKTVPSIILSLLNFERVVELKALIQRFRVAPVQDFQAWLNIQITQESF